jgi:hypothetical protein
VSHSGGDADVSAPGGASDWLTPRRNALGNHDRLNSLLMLMQLQLNDLANPRLDRG